jgi:RNA polymerase sigma-70 factor (ECF subfamily)
MELAHETRRGETHADFQRVALPWLAHVSRYARLLARNPSDADDLTQETFLRAYRGWGTFREGTDCRRWLFAICRNTFLRTRHRERRMVAVDDPEAEVSATTQLYWDAVGSGLDDVFDRVDFRPALERCLRAMLPEYAEAALLVDVQGYTYADAASELGVPVGTIRSRLFRARRLLQEGLMDYARDLGLEAARPALHDEEDEKKT